MRRLTVLKRRGEAVGSARRLNYAICAAARMQGQHRLVEGDAWMHGTLEECLRLPSAAGALRPERDRVDVVRGPVYGLKWTSRGAQPVGNSRFG